MRSFKFFIPCASFIFLIIFFPISARELTWTPEVMMTMRNIGPAEVSKDGSKALYNTSYPVITQTKSEYAREVFINDQLVLDAAHKASLPKWSPDETQIAFIGKHRQLYLRNSDGEISQITELETKVETFQWSPDGKSIAFIAQPPKTEDEKRKINGKLDVKKFGEFNVKKSLWIVDVKHAISTRITDEYHVIGAALHSLPKTFDWSPDGSEIAFMYTEIPGANLEFIESKIAIVDVESHTVTPFPNYAHHLSVPIYSHDGKWIAFLKGDNTYCYAINRDIALFNRQTHQIIELPSTENGGTYLSGPSLLGWGADNQHLLFYEPSGTKMALWKVPIDGCPSLRLDDVGQTISKILLSRGGEHLGLVLESAQSAPEAFISPVEKFVPVQVTHFNEQLSTLPKIQTKTIRWRSEDGTEIEGLLTLPIGYDSANRYPLLVCVHGGPMAMFKEFFVGRPAGYPIAAFADHGFAVLRCNPRGSTGYGREFREANYKDWGGGDFEDIMSGVDALIDLGIADPNRLGIMGWSFGGYMTAWTITQTQRFKAASMGAGISNLISMSGTSDLYTFMSEYLGTPFWTDSSLYFERSPIMHIQNIQTPLLMQHGMKDIRVPFSQSLEFYQALKQAGKEVYLVGYPRSSHHISEPKFVLDRMRGNVDWFVKRVLD